MILKVQDYIKELLFDNDCVIIPELGGFVTSYSSSEVHPIKHHFTPPSKRVAFNEKLKLNDGLLVSYIANSAKVSLKEATNLVVTFVDEISSKVKAKDKVVIEGIGNLSKNEEGRFQFKADLDENYLVDSFGLPDFFADPILRDDKNIKLRNKFKDRKAMSTEEIKEDKDKKEKKKGGATIWILSGIVVLLCCSAAFLFVMNKGDNNMLSSILPFGKSEPVEVVETDTIAADEEEEMYDEAGEITEEGEEMTEEEGSKEVFEESESTEEVAEEEEVSVSSGETFLTSLTGRYYVISGAFGKQGNAENLRDELISKGFDAKVLSPLGQKPLFRVSIADYDNRQEGIDKSGVENSAFGNALWVLKY